MCRNWKNLIKHFSHIGMVVNEYGSSTKLAEINFDKMPCWYYDKRDLRNTPSIRDGLDFETERRYRKEGARFIMDCGTSMGLGHNTVATGVVYFHRFYMFHSFRTFPRYVTACCCLFLAGKVEETPKKCMDIIKTARTLLQDSKFKSFGDDPKEEVMTLERILLQTIKFDLQVEHPYNFLVKYAKCLKGDKNKLQKMVQMAWNFVNDSLSTTVCLQWEPEITAVAMIHLASKLSKFIVDDWSGRQANHLRWWDMFVADITMEILEDICHQVLDLYQTLSNNPSSGNESPSQLPASKVTIPPASKRIPTSPMIKKSPNTATQTQAVNSNNVKSTTSAPVAAQENTLDNQPIPKLITTNDNVHYSYASSYGSMYAQQTFVNASQVAAVPSYTQPAMPPTLQTSTLLQFQQSNSNAAYMNYQAPPPPPSSRNFYHGPT